MPEASASVRAGGGPPSQSFGASAEARVKGKRAEAEAPASVKMWGPASIEKSRAGRAEGVWDRDEWDVALSDGAMYRIFRDRNTDAWFIDAIAD